MIINFLECLVVLVRRERKTRYSGGILGYLWAFITPMFWIAIVALSFKFLGRAVPINVGAEIFVATGILPYALMRQTITSQCRSLIANRYLQYIKPITINDIAFASAGLEFLNSLITSLIIYTAILLVFDAKAPADIFVLLIAIILSWGLGASFGTLVATIGRVSDSFARAVPIILRPLFWISGVFYSSNELPSGLLTIFSFNPLFHVVELTREGFFYGYEASISSFSYPIICILSFYLLTNLFENWIKLKNNIRHRI